MKLSIHRETIVLLTKLQEKYKNKALIYKTNGKNPGRDKRIKNNYKTISNDIFEILENIKKGDI